MELFVAVIVIVLDGGIFDGAVHPLDLTSAVSPRVVWLGEAMLDAVLAADLVEAVNPVARCPSLPVARQVSNWILLSVRMV